jgi:hypothetical protein
VTQTAQYNGRFPTDTITIALALLGTAYLLNHMTTDQVAALTTLLGLASQVLQLIAESRRR